MYSPIGEAYQKGVSEKVRLPQRARQTCDLSGLGTKAEIEPDLAEWDYGDYEGQRSDEIFKQRAGWNIFRDGCPNGEMPEQVSMRADRLIAHLNTLKGNVALFSHGQFGGVLAARWIGLALPEATHFPLDTASVSILRYDPRHEDVAVIALWNWRAIPGGCEGPVPSQNYDRTTGDDMVSD
jgi:probable phosphoglycerate mutase